jgi:hypothetical protein
LRGQGVKAMKSASEIALGESWYARAKRALDGMHALSWAAIGLTFAGWFLFDTLHVAWGPVERSVPFYDLAVVVDSPVRLFTGVAGHRGASTVILAVLCVAMLLAASSPRIRRSRHAWIVLGAPCALMLIVALLLYVRVSDDVLIASLGSPDTIGHDIRHLATHLLRHLRANAARSVSLAPGAYLAALGSLLLLARGIRGFVSR